MAVKEALQMVFGLENGKDHTVSLLGPKPTLNEAAVRPAMQEVITKDILLVNGAKATTIKSAAIVKTTTNKLI